MPTRKDTQQRSGRRQESKPAAQRDTRRGPAQRDGRHAADSHQKPSPTAIAKTLKGIRYPKSKSEIVAYAHEHDGDESVMRVLERLPERVYENMAEVEKGVARARH